MDPDGLKYPDIASETGTVAVQVFLNVLRMSHFPLRLMLMLVLMLMALVIAGIRVRAKSEARAIQICVSCPTCYVCMPEDGCSTPYLSSAKVLVTAVYIKRVPPPPGKLAKAV